MVKQSETQRFGAAHNWPRKANGEKGKEGDSGGVIGPEVELLFDVPR
jgi:hypothetical protein